MLYVCQISTVGPTSVVEVGRSEVIFRHFEAFVNGFLPGLGVPS